MLDEKLQLELITKGFFNADPYEESFESDQDLKRPQPPLMKPACAPKVSSASFFYP